MGIGSQAGCTLRQFVHMIATQAIASRVGCRAVGLQSTRSDNGGSGYVAAAHSLDHDEGVGIRGICLSNTGKGGQSSTPAVLFIPSVPTGLYRYIIDLLSLDRGRASRPTVLLPAMRATLTPFHWREWQVSMMNHPNEFLRILW